eukprot:COSAG06_NODE_48740_length_330_cov_0.623377_1_plen_55_part_10
MSHCERQIADRMIAELRSMIAALCIYSIPTCRFELTASDRCVLLPMHSLHRATAT